MHQENPSTLVLDTSVLLNFVKVGRTALLGRTGHRILLLDQVFAEVTRPEQRKAVQKAVDTGIFSYEQVVDLEEVSLFAGLHAGGRLGTGECAVLAVAIVRGFIAGVQDRQAQAEGRKRNEKLRIFQTEDIVVDLIRNGEMTLEDADRLLIEWAEKHRFASRISSFKTLL